MRFEDVREGEIYRFRVGLTADGKEPKYVNVTVEHDLSHPRGFIAKEVGGHKRFWRLKGAHELHEADLPGWAKKAMTRDTEAEMAAVPEKGAKPLTPKQVLAVAEKAAAAKVENAVVPRLKKGSESKVHRATLVEVPCAEPGCKETTVMPPKRAAKGTHRCPDHTKPPVSMAPATPVAPPTKNRVVPTAMKAVSEKATLSNVEGLWLNAMKEAGKSQTTINSYAGCLKVAFAFFGADCRAHEVATRIEEFNNDKSVTHNAKGEPNAEATVLKTRRALRLALTFCGLLCSGCGVTSPASKNHPASCASVS